MRQAIESIAGMASDKLLAALSHFRHVAIVSVLDCFREPYYYERSLFYLTLSSVARNGLIAWVFFTMCIRNNDGAAVTDGNRYLALLSLKGVAVMIHTIQALYSITVYLAFFEVAIIIRYLFKLGPLANSRHKARNLGTQFLGLLDRFFMRSGNNHTKFQSRGRMFHLDGKLNGSRDI